MVEHMSSNPAAPARADLGRPQGLKLKHVREDTRGQGNHTAAGWGRAESGGMTGGGVRAYSVHYPRSRRDRGCETGV
jgi:hypothetical protein